MDPNTSEPQKLRPVVTKLVSAVYVSWLFRLSGPRNASPWGCVTPFSLAEASASLTGSSEWEKVKTTPELALFQARANQFQALCSFSSEKRLNRRWVLGHRQDEGDKGGVGGKALPSVFTDWLIFSTLWPLRMWGDGGPQGLPPGSLGCLGVTVPICPVQYLVHGRRPVNIW